MNFLYFILAFLAFVHLCVCSRVLELSDKFSEIRREGGYWLVKFYAPWCGHCKRLEPIWGHVAQALHRTNIKVGKVDCTRFSSLATEFSINGFPTIKFITATKDFSFNGDRTKDDIINFALRMAGPSVQEVTKSETLKNLKNMNQLFFMYIGNKEGILWESFMSVAAQMQAHAFFYATTREIAALHVNIEELPAVFVHKESAHYFYPLALQKTEYDASHLNDSMYKWINEERFATFPKVTRGNINEILQTKKYIVLVVVEENKLQEISPDMLAFRNMVEGVIRKNREKYHKNFQFGWVGTPELAYSIAMEILTLPHLLVLNSTTNHHHIIEQSPEQITTESLEEFLDKIYNQTAPIYGGNNLFTRIYRMYFEARTTLSDMWKGNPVLTTLLFGLPLGFLSLILYSICCADILDADEEEEELLHEKKE